MALKVLFSTRTRLKFIGVPVVGLAVFSLFSRSSDTTGRRTLKSFDLGISCLPKSLTVPQLIKVAPCDCGEDSYAMIEKDGRILLAVADGVGSWRKKGINPALFSRALCSYLRHAFLGSTNNASLVELIKESFDSLVKDTLQVNVGGRPFGSSTVCAAILEGDEAKVANIGDSGLLLVRQGKVVFRTEVQQHRFNAPFQLLHGPDGRIRDMTEKAQQANLKLQPGDVLMLASDGVLDNVTEDELAVTVDRYANMGAQRTAELVAMQAWKQSLMAEKDSPFSQEARRHGIEHTGGKPDDITVLIAIYEK